MHETKIRILHICKVFLPVHGGIQVVIKRITDGLSALFDTTVVSCSRDQAGEYLLGNSRLLNAKSYGEWLSLPVAPGVVPRIRKAIGNAELVCIHYPFPLAELSLLNLNLNARGLIVYWHSEIVAQKYARHLVRPLTHRMLKKADRIVVSSPALLEHSNILKDYKSRVEVVPFGYQLPAEEVAISDNGYYICVGRHVSYKGIENLIRAWERLSCKLVLVGNGQLLFSHKALSVELGTDDRIEFIEHADDKRVLELIAGSRALILPSVAANEAFGLVQIEAMALGKPIVNTRLDSGVPWVARDGQEAITVVPGEPVELRDAVLRLEGDAGLRTRLGQAARLRWERKFTADAFASSTASLYQRVLEEKHAAHDAENMLFSSTGERAAEK